ncbi:MAG: hypothetical protein ACUVTM_08120 [Candidatus Bathyarchaeia archaeon]
MEQNILTLAGSLSSTHGRIKLYGMSAFKYFGVGLMVTVEPLIDSLAAACFLFGAVFYLMVAYGERRGGAAWRLFGLTSAVWFTVMYIKLISNMAGWTWAYGAVRSTIVLSLILYLLGLAALARMLR